MGLLQVEGTLDLAQFWPHGTSAGDPARVVGMGLVQVPEGRRIFTRLTVEENLRAGGLGSRDRAAKATAPALPNRMQPK